MTDISKEALASAWEEFEICAQPNGSKGDLDLYDVDGMQDYAYTIHSIAQAQAARIEQLEAALMEIDATVDEIRALMTKEPNT